LTAPPPPPLPLLLLLRIIINGKNTLSSFLDHRLFVPKVG